MPGFQIVKINSHTLTKSHFRSFLVKNHSILKTIVKTVVMPRETRAGVAEIEIQNEIQLNITINVVGT